MTIFNEVQQLEELTVIGKALIKYAISIEPGLVFERHDGWWLPPMEKNFIGFQFQWTDMISITLSLYGSPTEQFKQDDLTIRKGKFNYSKCRLTDDYQLMAATVCIWRAHQLFHKERHVETGGLLLLDEAQAEDTDWTRSRHQEPRPESQKYLWLSELRSGGSKTGASSKTTS
ncbi:MAG: hypothetical protein OEU50_11705 [Gammaproteobacteria bacterium]|nr:hypothetical protein [Gammaproteobacteria bacterium]